MFRETEIKYSLHIRMYEVFQRCREYRDKDEGSSHIIFMLSCMKFPQRRELYSYYLHALLYEVFLEIDIESLLLED